jgi:septal ring-binding cell division protein DamX
VHEAARELRLDDEMVPVQKPSKKAPRRKKRWLVAAVIGVVLILLTGAAWTQLGSSLGAGLGGDDSSRSSNEAQASEMPPKNLPDRMAEPASDVDPAPVETPDRSALLNSYREVENLRSNGPVYAIHLISFRSESEARQYAMDLVADHPSWRQPFYVEETYDRPAWFRVTTGGFADRAEGVAQARRIKSDLGLRYAKLTQLKPGARALLPVAARATEDSTSNE